jgi:hypothetical protein
LWASNKLLVLEGDDVDILKRLYNTLFPAADSSLETIPILEIGGWGGWNYAIGSKMLMKNAIGENMLTYCILDSDYHHEDEIIGRNKEAKEKDVQLHKWTKKELENYIIVPSAIQRVIEKNKRKTKEINASVVAEILKKIVEELEEGLMDNLAESYRLLFKTHGVQMANKYARQKISQSKSSGKLIDLTSGKDILREFFSGQRKNTVHLYPTIIWRMKSKAQKSTMKWFTY